MPTPRTLRAHAASAAAPPLAQMQQAKMAHELTLAEERKATLDAKQAAAEVTREASVLKHQLTSLQAPPRPRLVHRQRRHAVRLLHEPV